MLLIRSNCERFKSQLGRLVIVISVLSTLGCSSVDPASEAAVAITPEVTSSPSPSNDPTESGQILMAQACNDLDAYRAEWVAFQFGDLQEVPESVNQAREVVVSSMAKAGLADPRWTDALTYFNILDQSVNVYWFFEGSPVGASAGAIDDDAWARLQGACQIALS